MQHSRLKDAAHRATCAFTAFVLACGLTAFPVGGAASRAVADDELTAGSAVFGQAASASTDNVIRAASYRAAEPAPEILGLSNVGTNTAWQGVGEKTWTAPYYYLFGDSDFNSNPNPFMVNAVTNNASKLTSDDAGYATPTMVFYNRQGGPTAAMYKYKAANDASGGSDKVWEMKPDVILGTGGVDNPDLYNTADYALGVSKDYTTTAVKYDSTDIYTMIQSMYDLAAAADAADKASDTKSLRYGLATTIAGQYEEYVLGTYGYVLKQLNGGAKKKVALIGSYDSSTDSYNLVKTGVAEGTATKNRYLEAVQPVAVNIADSMDNLTVKKKDLEGVDLILIGSQSGREEQSRTATILNALGNDLAKKTYWVDVAKSGDGSQGSTYGVTMNSVENAQNVGRILGCLYPDYVSQADWVAYYYDMFYHLNSGKVAEAIANAMDGVRNWATTDSASDYTSMTTWENSHVSTYNRSTVADKLKSGLTYLNSNSTDTAKVPSYVKLNSGELDGATIKLTGVTDDKVTYTGTAQTPAFTMTLKGATETALAVDDSGSITNGNDKYEVAYQNNTNVGTATISVREIGGNGYVTKTFTIAQQTTTDTLALTLDSSNPTYTGEAIAPTVTSVKLGSDKALTEAEYTLSYAVKTEVADNNAKLDSDGKPLNAGTYVVTATANNYFDNDGKAVTATADLTVNAQGIDSSGANWKIDDIQSQAYTGKETKPAITVNSVATKDSKEVKTAVDASNYTVAYSDNTEAGKTAKATVTAKGNFTGTVDKTYVIYKLEETGTADSEIDINSAQTATNITLANDEESVKLNVADATSTASAEAKAQKVANASDFKIFDVKLQTYDSSSTVKRTLDGESGKEFGKISLTFKLGTQYAGKKATIKQTHVNAFGNRVIIDRGAQTVPASGSITVSNIDKLSEFAISLQDQYTVTFNSNGGSAVAAKTYASGDTLGTLTTPSRSGYTFNGWYSGSTKVSSSTVVSSNLTLTASWTQNKTTMYRVYNPYSGEHLYTYDTREYSYLGSIGWKQEKTAWIAPAYSSKPVYRVYNPFNGDHHYTTEASERNYLVSIGWKDEKVGWYSDTSKTKAVYRLFNPYLQAGSHHYTTSASERDYLKSIGWKDEGIGWYALS